MSKPTSNLKDKVVNKAVNSLRKSKRIEQISFASIASELDVGIDEITSFYSTTEDIFLKLKKKIGNLSTDIGTNKLRKPKPQEILKEPLKYFLKDL